MAEGAKAQGAFRTIGELSRDTGLPLHILRYWETRFPQLKPLTRAGNRRYYRPEDVALVRRIDQALNRDGYTVRGVQQLLASGAEREGGVPGVGTDPNGGYEKGDDPVAPLRAIRALIAGALTDDAA